MVVRSSCPYQRCLNRNSDIKKQSLPVTRLLATHYPTQPTHSIPAQFDALTTTRSQKADLSSHPTQQPTLSSDLKPRHTMDIYDPGLMGAAGRVDGSSTPTRTHSDETSKTELDQNVEQLVGNISSWWSGFAKKSQDSINHARREMENRGGIVNYAKSEYAKLETSISEAQKKARDQSQARDRSQDDAQAQTAESTVDATAIDAAGGPSKNGKGKQRAIDDQDTQAGIAAGSAANQGPTLGASVSSLFSKLTSDPRLVQLQHSLTSTLQSVSSPQDQRRDGGDEKTHGTTPVNIQESLSKLSLTIQSHLPHLDLKESQQLATRYLHATESFAREVQSDMKEFVGELVRIVPPEGEADPNPLPSATALQSEIKKTEPVDKATTASRADQPASADARSSTSLHPPALSEPAPPAPVDDEDDFAWDEDDEEAAAGTETAPTASQLQEPPATTAAPSETKPAAKQNDGSEEDSDWE